MLLLRNSAGVLELTCLWALTDIWQQIEAECRKWLLALTLPITDLVCLLQTEVTALVYEYLRCSFSCKWQHLSEKGGFGGEMRNESTSGLTLLAKFLLIF